MERMALLMQSLPVNSGCRSHLYRYMCRGAGVGMATPYSGPWRRPWHAAIAGLRHTTRAVLLHTLWPLSSCSSSPYMSCYLFPRRHSRRDHPPHRWPQTATAIGINSCTQPSLELPLYVIDITAQHESVRGAYEALSMAKITADVPRCPTKREVNCARPGPFRTQ